MLPAVAAVAAAVAVLGVGAVFDVGPFADDGPYRLEVVDRLEDCREAGRDTGERCDPGADIETIGVWQSGDSTIVVELALTEAPGLGPGLEWTVEFFGDVANAHTDGGIICRLSTIVEGADPGSAAVSHALDPNTIPREAVEHEACAGGLEAATARFSIDVTGQSVTDEFRLIGLVRLEYPHDRAQPGSEDDFLVRTSLADLQGPGG